MKKIAILLLPVVALFSCHSTGNNSNGNSDSLSNNNSAAKENISAKSTAKWQTIFNGKDLTGWRGFQNKPTNAWEVKNGVLHCDGHKKGAAHTDLITDKEYKNFALSIQWKISPESNSGIMFHVSEKYPSTYLSGPEYQIVDDKGWSGGLAPWQHTGCNYAMQVADTIPVNPIGAWNTTKIVVNGAHVEHWLNGTKILAYELWSPEWEKQKSAHKWKDVAEYGMSKTGHIALQYHGGDVWFKNIKLKVL